MRGEMLVGVISDTHGLLRPGVIPAFQGVSLIVHAGDVGRGQVIEDLSTVAPVHAVRGNMDHGLLADALPRMAVVRAGRISLVVLHNLDDLDLDPAAAGVGAVIHGHTHRASVREHKGVVYLNPGSAGPRRFQLPVTVARLRVREEGVEGEIVELAL